MLVTEWGGRPTADTVPQHMSSQSRPPTTTTAESH